MNKRTAERPSWTGAHRWPRPGHRSPWRPRRRAARQPDQDLAEAVDVVGFLDRRRRPEGPASGRVEVRSDPYWPAGDVGRKHDSAPGDDTPASSSTRAGARPGAGRPPRGVERVERAHLRAERSVRRSSSSWASLLYATARTVSSLPAPVSQQVAQALRTGLPDAGRSPGPARSGGPPHPAGPGPGPRMADGAGATSARPSSTGSRDHGVTRRRGRPGRRGLPSTHRRRRRRAAAHRRPHPWACRSPCRLPAPPPDQPAGAGVVGVGPDQEVAGRTRLGIGVERPRLGGDRRAPGTGAGSTASSTTGWRMDRPAQRPTTSAGCWRPPHG